MAVHHQGMRVAGIPIRVQPTFFIIIVLLGVIAYPIPYAVTWVVIATTSVIVHELGHAIAFRAFGLRPSITLHSMGGLTTASVGEPGAPPFTPLRSIVTSLAGPFAALVLFGAPAWMAALGQGFEPLSLARMTGDGAVLVRSTGAEGVQGWMVANPLQVLLSQAVFINVGWSLLNLIPVLPLDGGNVTSSVLELFSRRNGRRVANLLSIVVAVGLGWWAFQRGFIFGPLLAAMLIGMNVTELASARRDVVDDDLADAARALVEFAPGRAQQLSEKVLAGKTDAGRRRVAIELLAWSRLALGDPAGVERLIASLPVDAGPTATLRAALSLAQGRTAEGVAMMAWALANDPDRSAKVLGAMAVAQAGQVDAVARELLLLGEEGRHGGAELRAGLDLTGHRVEARRVGQLLAL
jgi:stage IV sporulation protein FB